MELSEWLKKTGMSANKLAALAKTGHMALYNAIAQKRGLTRKVAERISRATKGEISVMEAMCPEKHVALTDRRKNRKKEWPICRFCRQEIKPIKKVNKCKKK